MLTRVIWASKQEGDFILIVKKRAKDEPVNLKQISDEERKKYEEELVNKLICLYINLSYDFVDKGYCTETEIEAALREYKGMEKGPVTMGNEIGFNKVYDLLMHFYNKTQEKVFYPSAIAHEKSRDQKGVTVGKTSCHYRHQFDDILRSRSNNELGEFGGREKRGKEYHPV